MPTSRNRSRIALGGALGLATAAVAATAIAASTDVGPNSDTEPYILPAANGVKITSLLTVSDGESASNGYEMAGIPDGLGATKDGSRDFKLFMNHEISSNLGAVRRHGQAGAFVSELTIDRKSLEVEDGDDLVDPGVRFWNYPEQQYQSAPSPGGRQPARP